MTPHVAGWTEGTLEARAKLIAENIGRAARGETPLNLIPPPEGRPLAGRPKPVIMPP
jgi:phosphoglycerate dehydrogenase-like enzyme